MVFDDRVTIWVFYPSAAVPFHFYVAILALWGDQVFDRASKIISHIYPGVGVAPGKLLAPSTKQASKFQPLGSKMEPIDQSKYRSKYDQSEVYQNKTVRL